MAQQPISDPPAEPAPLLASRDRPLCTATDEQIEAEMQQQAAAWLRGDDED